MLGVTLCAAAIAIGMLHGGVTKRDAEHHRSRSELIAAALDALNNGDAERLVRLTNLDDADPRRPDEHVVTRWRSLASTTAKNSIIIASVEADGELDPDRTAREPTVVGIVAKPQHVRIMAGDREMFIELQIVRLGERHLLGGLTGYPDMLEDLRDELCACSDAECIGSTLAEYNLHRDRLIAMLATGESPDWLGQIDEEILACESPNPD